MNDLTEINWVTGIEFYYYYVCIRKLWLFSKGIGFENNSDRVLQGKVAHEYSHEREQGKEVQLEDIKVDILNDLVKEFKITSSMKEASIMQLKYYLFYLKRSGIDKEGSIHYLKERKVENVALSKDDEEEIISVLEKIDNIKKQDNSPKIKKQSICTKCSYYEFCFSKEVDHE
ncbi:MAG: CRISPR-associated protein Cas4 [Oscillospiraceae bacterium]|nr:CRISPR-associated protein Cas4 [Oscillospiraceae bacterium]